MVKTNVVGMVVTGGNPETVAAYLFETKPDVCALIEKNPNATIKLFFEKDESLRQLLDHVTETQEGPEDFDGFLNKLRKCIIEMAAPREEEPAATGVN